MRARRGIICFIVGLGCFSEPKKDEPPPHPTAPPLVLAPALTTLPPEAPAELELFFRRSKGGRVEELHLSREVAQYHAESPDRPHHPTDHLTLPSSPAALQESYEALRALSLQGAASRAPAIDGHDWSLVLMLGGRSYQPSAASEAQWREVYQALDALRATLVDSSQQDYSLTLDTSAFPPGVEVLWEDEILYPREGFTTGPVTWKTRALPGKYRLWVRPAAPTSQPSTKPASAPAPLFETLVFVGMAQPITLHFQHNSFSIF